MKNSQFIEPPTTVESVIATLYEVSSESGMVPFSETEQYFSQLNDLIISLPPLVADQIIDVVCKLCGLFEHAAFEEGVKIGFLFSRELKT